MTKSEVFTLSMHFAPTDGKNSNLTHKYESVQTANEVTLPSVTGTQVCRLECQRTFAKAVENAYYSVKLFTKKTLGHQVGPPPSRQYIAN